MSEMKVAAFMPVLNEGGRIERAITSLQNQTHSISKLYVIDGGSTDSTHEEVEKIAKEVDFEIELDVLQGAGVRYSSQYGAEKAAEHITEELGEDDGMILRVEGDSSLDENFVEEASRYLEREDYKVFGAPVKPHDPSTKPVKKRIFAIYQNSEMLPKGRGMAFMAKDFYEFHGYRMEPGEEIKESNIDCLEDGILVSKLQKEGKVAFSHNTHVRSTVPSTTATSMDRWKKGLRIEREIGPTGYYTKAVSPLNVMVYPFRRLLE